MCIDVCLTRCLQTAAMEGLIVRLLLIAVLYKDYFRVEVISFEHLTLSFFSPVLFLCQSLFYKLSQIAQK